MTETTVVFHIGSRRKEELTALIGEAFLGWLVSHGYCVYRDRARRQRCLAHLSRKAKALAEGCYGVDGSRFGGGLARDLRRLIEKVAEADRTDGPDASIKRLMKRIQWNCQCNKYQIEEKARQLAREILNDRDPVIAFVNDPRLPPTNNNAERVLHHAVIETCRKRGVDVWAYCPQSHRRCPQGRSISTPGSPGDIRS